MPVLRSNGIDIYFEIHGAGEPLLLIGGLANDVTDYERTGILDLLAERFQLIVFDNRGAGRSEKPKELYSIPMMAQDAAGLLAGLGLARAHVIGVSMGGRIALELALRHFELVNRLVLVSTGPRTSPSWRGRVLFAIGRLPIFKGKHPQPYYAFKNQMAATSSYDCTSRLGGIRALTLVIHGRKDSVAPFSIAEEMQQRIRNSRMIAVKGGHAFLFFRPREFAAHVTAFLTTPDELLTAPE